jgi:apolipoprotein N-acyltransferase
MLAGATLCVLGYWLGFPNETARPPGAVLLFPLGTLVLSLRASSTLQAVFWTCLAGSLAAYPPIHWLGLPTRNHGGEMARWAFLFPVLAALGHGQYLAIYATLVRRAWIRHGVFAFALHAGLLWMAMEWAKSAWCKFPLLTLTAGLSPWPVLIQACALMGSQALAGTCVSCLALVAAGSKEREPEPVRFAGGFASAWRGRPLRPGRPTGSIRPAPVLAALAVTASLGLYGAAALKAPVPEAPAVSVTCVQGMVPVDMVWTQEKQQAAVRHMSDLTQEAILLGPSDLTLWTETILPAFFDLPTPVTDAVRDVAHYGGIRLMFGALSRVKEGERVVPRNRVFLLGPDGQDAAIYDKQQLVPFGEYMPRWFNWLPRFIADTADVTPGPLDAPIAVGPARVGPLICFESMFPALSLGHAEKGANLLVNLSNDLWFAGSAEPELLLEHTVLRAVEQGRYLVRATNSGITALIDNRGRIVASLPPGRIACARFAAIPLLAEPTPFTRMGRIFVPAALILCVAWSLLLLFPNRKPLSLS